MDKPCNIQYRVDVVEVHSGDDLVLMVDLGIDGLYKKVRARLQGVDTPDAYKTAANTEAGQVRKYVQKLTIRKRCFVHVHNMGVGGWKVDLFLGANDSTDCLNDILKAKGYIYEGKA